MKTKICKDCKKKKLITSFYGVQGECKKCTKIRVKKRYYNPMFKKRIRAYEKKRNQYPERKKNKAIYALRRNKKYPNRIKAERRVSNAIRDGRLKRMPCEVCGNKKVEAHHEDYRKYLNVNWLCFKHHRKRHDQLKNKKNEQIPNWLENQPKTNSNRRCRGVSAY